VETRLSYKHAVQTAESILANTGYQVPVDVERIAEAHAVSVVKQDLEDSVSGVLVIKDDTGIIGVNSNHHPNRQRFTVAHELGHFLLHPDAGRVFVDRSPVFFRDGMSSEGTSQQEIEANAFAAALLMPEAELKRLLDDHPVDAFDEMSVRRLAARLGVSAQALTIRLTRLGLVSEF
jgi:Zn-dependent peptidase ImmA (M78 family)